MHFTADMSTCKFAVDICLNGQIKKMKLEKANSGGKSATNHMHIFGQKKVDIRGEIPANYNNR